MVLVGWGDFLTLKREKGTRDETSVKLFMNSLCGTSALSKKHSNTYYMPRCNL